MTIHLIGPPANFGAPQPLEAYEAEMVSQMRTNTYTAPPTIPTFGGATRRPSRLARQRSMLNNRLSHAMARRGGRVVEGTRLLIWRTG
jgi:hypothetical protein